MKRAMVCQFPVALLVIAAGIACAQTTSVDPARDYPNKPIRMLTTEPGGAGDIALRILGPDLSGALGQPIIIDNRPLAKSGEIVARATPDGYTATVYGSTLWLGPLMQRMPYDPLKDFAPVTLMTRAPNVLVVHQSVPVNSVKELIAWAKAKPGILNYSSGNSGSNSHLSMELFKSMAGVNIVRIPYKGAGPAAQALVAGETQVMVTNPFTAGQSLKSGRIKALAVTTAQRSLLLPDLPTVAATGVPGYEAASVAGMVITAGTPAAIIAKLNHEVANALNKPANRDKLLSTGVEAAPGAPQEFTEFIKGEVARMSKVIKDAGIRAE